MTPAPYEASVSLLIGCGLTFLSIAIYQSCSSCGLANGHREAEKRTQPVQLTQKNIRLSIAS